MTTDERLETLEKELARAKRRNRRLLACAGLVVGAFALVWTLAKTTPAVLAQAVGGTVPPPQGFLRHGRKMETLEEHEAAEDAIQLASFKRWHDEVMNAALRSAEDAPDENSVLAIFQRASSQVSTIRSENPRVQNAYLLYYEGAQAKWADRFARLAKAVGRAEKVTRAKQAVGKAEKVIRANTFIVEDEDGKRRAMLTATKDQPRLVLFGENGKVRAVLGLDKDGPGLGLCDENGKVKWQAP